MQKVTSSTSAPSLSKVWSLLRELDQLMAALGGSALPQFFNIFDTDGEQSPEIECLDEEQHLLELPEQPVLLEPSSGSCLAQQSPEIECLDEFAAGCTDAIDAENEYMTDDKEDDDKEDENSAGGGTDAVDAENEYTTDDKEDKHSAVGGTDAVNAENEYMTDDKVEKHLVAGGAAAVYAERDHDCEQEIPAAGGRGAIPQLLALLQRAEQQVTSEDRPLLEDTCREINDLFLHEVSERLRDQGLPQHHLEKWPDFVATFTALSSRSPSVTSSADGLC